MAYFIATLAPDRYSNWEVCKREGLWGLVGRGTNWHSNGLRVSAGDHIFVWRGGKPNGFIAEMEALGPMVLAGQSGAHIPWEQPEWFGGVIPMRVLAELDKPVGDRFPNHNGRVGLRFGFNNTALQHIFEQIPPEVAAQISVIFPRESAELGVPWASRDVPAPITPASPFDVDPDAVDRALLAHHRTVEALAEWVTTQGWLPRLPRLDEPRYDLAWNDGSQVCVAEIKSTTPDNREMQLRLGLGQVLRYRSRLRLTHDRVAAWLVPDVPVSDLSWTATCDEVSVRLVSVAELRAFAMSR